MTRLEKLHLNVLFLKRKNNKLTIFVRQGHQLNQQPAGGTRYSGGSDTG
jgi:hypothetical protein